VTVGLELATVAAFVILIAAAIAVVVVARRVGVPDTVGLVLLGLAASVLLPRLGLEVTPELVLLVLLPGIIFDGGYRTHVEDLRQSLGAILVLAVPGVIIVAAFTGLVLDLTTELTFGQAFLVGAIVSATDPAAVIATFRRLRTPRLLGTVVETESLVNDGTGVVLFTVALAVLTGGAPETSGVVTFLAAVVVSPLLGIAAGYIAARLIGMTTDHLLEVSITIVLAYGVYAGAEAVHLSGILATVTAAVTLGIFGRGSAMSARARDAIDAFWEVVAFVLTVIVFLLVGVVIELEALARAAGPIVIGILAITVGRAIVVYGLIGVGARALRGPRGMPKMPLPWLHVLFWSGLRGAVAVALVLSIPRGLDGRDLVADVAFGIILFTLLAQGSTIGIVIDRTIGPARRGGPSAGTDEAGPGARPAKL